MSVASWLIVLVGVLVEADEPAMVVDKQELELLKGTWSIVSIEDFEGNRSYDEDEGYRVVIDGDKWTVIRDQRSNTLTITRLDPAMSPKQIDTTIERDGKLTVERSIYKLEGNTLMTCSGFDERPERFAVDGKDFRKNVMAVLKRADP